MGTKPVKKPSKGAAMPRERKRNCRVAPGRK